MKEHFFLAYDKTPVCYLSFDPPEKVRGMMILLHGAGEHARRYGEFAGLLTEKGISVHGMDLRGYGKSGGAKAHAPGFDAYGKDVAALYRHLRKCEQAPLFLFGHSLGGLIAAYTSAFFLNGKVTGLILSSPCLALSYAMPRYKAVIAALLGVVKPRQLLPMENLYGILTHDKDIEKKAAEDPLMFLQMSAGLYAHTKRAMQMASGIARLISEPAVIFAAGDDRVVDVAAAHRFYENLSSDDKKFKSYDGMYHEILNEIGRERVSQDIIAWIEKRLPNV